MAADFFFDKPTFEIQPLKTVAVFKWQHLKNPEVQYAIAAEEQYLNFHLYMLANLRHTEAGKLAQPQYKYELGLSVRAGAVKAAVLVAASILEAALRTLAELRGYPLNKDLRRRTFGNVIGAWEDAGAPRPDVAAIWQRCMKSGISCIFIRPQAMRMQPGTMFLRQKMRCFKVRSRP